MQQAARRAACGPQPARESRRSGEAGRRTSAHAWTKFLLLSTTALSGLMVATSAEAVCVNVTTGVTVTAVAGQPNSNESVVCSTSPPNPPPANVIITAAPGSTNVSVTIQPGSILSPNLRAIGVVDQSTVLNQGQITTSGLNAFGITSTGTGSTLTNQGQIATSGANSFGIDARGSGTTIVNTNSGAINVTGGGAAGIRTVSSGTSITNGGRITANGASTPSDFASGVKFATDGSGTFINQSGGDVSSATDFGARVLNGNVTIENSGRLSGNAGGSVSLGTAISTGTVVVNNFANGTLQGNFVFQGNGSTQLNLSGSLNGNIVGSGNGTFLLQHQGNFNGGITITGNGQNTVNILSGRNINGPVTISGAANAIDNSGSFNQGLALSGNGTNSVTNRSGATINQSFSITGDAQNTIVNSGTFNNGVTLTGNGSTSLTNSAGATINGNIISTGTAPVTIDAAGTINNSILLDSGNDIVTVRPTAEINFSLSLPRDVNGVISLADGTDQFFMLGGTVNNQVLMGNHDDVAVISGGTITQAFKAEAGNDSLLWSGGKVGSVDMGTGTDVATLRNLTPNELPAGLRVDGGEGNDRLIWDNTAAADVARFVNWELIELTNNSRMTFSSTLTLGDAGTGTGILHIDSTSTVFAGNGAHSIVPFTSSSLVEVTNAGTIDLTNGSAAATDSLTISGRLLWIEWPAALHTYLGGDGSPWTSSSSREGPAVGSDRAITRQTLEDRAFRPPATAFWSSLPSTAQ